MSITIDFDSFETLACDRLRNFWGADEFEIEVFQEYVQGYYGCDVDFLQLVDNFHVNNYSQIDEEDKEKYKANADNYSLFYESEGRAAVVY